MASPFRVCVGNVSTGKGRGRGRPAQKLKEKPSAKPKSIEKVCEGFEDFSSLDPSASKDKTVQEEEEAWEPKSKRHRRAIDSDK